MPYTAPNRPMSMPVPGPGSSQAPTPLTSVIGLASPASSRADADGRIDSTPTTGVVMRKTATMPPAAKARLPVSDATSSATPAKTTAQSALYAHPGSSLPSSSQTPRMPLLVVNAAPRNITSCGPASSSHTAVTSAATLAPM